MLFYTTLLLVSLLLTLVILSLYKLIVLVIRKTFRRRFANEKFVSTDYPDQRNFSRNSIKSTEAWGGYGHSSPSTMARTHPAAPTQVTPWGWPGHDQPNHDHPGHDHPGHDYTNGEYHPVPASSREANLNNYLSRHYVNPQVVGTGKHHVDRADRDDRSAYIGRVHNEVRKDTRKAVSKDLHDRVEGKPWGW